MRPRKKNSGLPSRVYLRSGRYYYVHRGRWHSLSRDYDESMKMVESIDPENPHIISSKIRDDMRAAIYRVFHARRRDAKGRGIPFEITEEYIQKMAKSNKWRCAMTGIPFELKKPKNSRRNPFGPSIDRIVPKKGYVEGNVRVVCLATNFAMNEWGEEVLTRLSVGWFTERVRTGNVPTF